MKERTLEQRFSIWKQKHPNGTRKEFEEQSRIARNKYLTRHSTARNPDGTILINPSLEDAPSLDQVRDIMQIIHG